MSKYSYTDNTPLLKFVSKVLSLATTALLIATPASFAYLRLNPVNELPPQNVVYERLENENLDTSFVSLLVNDANPFRQTVYGADSITRLPMPKNNQTHKVYIDFPATDSQYEIFSEGILRINELFEIINPAYRFELVRGNPGKQFLSPYKTIVSLKDLPNGVYGATGSYLAYSQNGADVHYANMKLDPDIFKDEALALGVFMHEFTHVLGVGDAYLSKNSTSDTIMQSGDKIKSGYSRSDLDLLNCLYRTSGNQYSEAEIDEMLNDYYYKYNTWYISLDEDLNKIKQDLTPEFLEQKTGETHNIEPIGDGYVMFKNVSDSYVRRNPDKSYSYGYSTTVILSKFKDNTYARNALTLNVFTNGAYGSDGKANLTVQKDNFTVVENGSTFMFKYGNKVYSAKLAEEEVILSEVGEFITEQQYNKYTKTVNSLRDKFLQHKDDAPIYAELIMNAFSPELLKARLDNYSYISSDCLAIVQKNNYQWDKSLTSSKIVFENSYGTERCKLENGILSIKNSQGVTQSECSSRNGIYLNGQFLYVKFDNQILKIRYEYDILSNKLTLGHVMTYNQSNTATLDNSSDNSLGAEQ